MYSYQISIRENQKGNQEWTIQRHRKHWAYKNGQSRDTGNIGQSRMDNPETQETLGIQEAG